MLQPTVSVRDLDITTIPKALRLYLVCHGTKILLVQFLLCLGFRIYLGNPTLPDLYIILGVALWWPFQEWWAHWLILHSKPQKIGPFKFDIPGAVIHRFHHQHPWDLHGIFVPWQGIAILVPIHFAAWYFLTPTWELCLTGMTVYTLATLLYEWVHFFAHIPYRPTYKYLQKIQTHHRAHHFKNENYYHAFMIPYIDTMFGTGPDPKTVPRSATTKTLGIEEDKQANT